MSTSPPPEEREKKDKEDRAREAEEQAKLPYKWTQTIQDLDITISVPSNLRGKDIVVEMKKMYLKVGVKGQEPVIDVLLPPPALQLPSSQRPSPTLPKKAPTQANSTNRDPSPTKFTPPKAPGRSKPRPPAKKSACTSTKRTSNNGGHR